jgi:hypothetical protein
MAVRKNAIDRWYFTAREKLRVHQWLVQPRLRQR